MGTWESVLCVSVKICKHISESLYFIAEVVPAAVKVCDNVFDLDNKETNRHDLFKTK